MNKLKRKVILITGASSGIGASLAKKLAPFGVNLILVARRLDRLELLKSELTTKYECQCHIIQADLSQPKQIEDLVSESVETFGRIDVLVNCAGYGIFKLAKDFSYEEIEEMFKVNTFAMMYLSQLVSEVMIKQNCGQIIFLASIAGKIATVASSVYSASKFAIIGYANALRLELKKENISVTTVNPGPVRTEFFNHDESTKAYFEKVKNFSLKADDLSDRIIASMICNKGPKREINLPILFSSAAILYYCFPKIGDYLAGNLFNYKEEQ